MTDIVAQRKSRLRRYVSAKRHCKRLQGVAKKLDDARGNYLARPFDSKPRSSATDTFASRWPLPRSMRRRLPTSTPTSEPTRSTWVRHPCMRPERLARMPSYSQLATLDSRRYEWLGARERQDMGKLRSQGRTFLESCGRLNHRLGYANEALRPCS